MIGAILPDGVIAVEARDDSIPSALLPAEEASIRSAVETRREEFTTARACARAALARLGLPPIAITIGERGEPEWPAGLVGSITHCEGYRGCAVARSTEIATVGIDAEPNAPLPEGVLSGVARTEELSGLSDLKHAAPAIRWDRLLFSAKESVYKAWYPLAKRWLGFEDAIVAFDTDSGLFEARLLVSGPEVAGRPLTGFSGRWLACDGLVLTAIAVPTSTTP